jgi:hypothetical protein
MKKKRQSFCWHPLAFFAAIAWESLIVASAVVAMLAVLGVDGLQQHEGRGIFFAVQILLVGVVPGWLLGYVALASIRAPLPLGIWLVIGVLRAFLGSISFALVGWFFESNLLVAVLLLPCYGGSTVLYWLLWNRACQRGIHGDGSA